MQIAKGGITNTLSLFAILVTREVITIALFLVLRNDFFLYIISGMDHLVSRHLYFRIYYDLLGDLITMN